MQEKTGWCASTIQMPRQMFQFSKNDDEKELGQNQPFLGDNFIY